MDAHQDFSKFELTETKSGGLKKLVIASIIIHVSLFIIIPLLSSIHGTPKVVPQNYFFDMMDAKQRWKAPAKKERAPAPAPAKAKAKKAIEKAISTKKEIAKKEEKQKEEEKPAPVETAANEEAKDDGKESDQPLTSEMTISGPNFPFNFYGTQIRNAVEQNWRQAPQELLGSETQLVVVIKFDIQRNGSVANLQILESSWNSLLDKLAMRAIEKAKIPPLPGDFESLTITYRLVLRRS